MLAQQAGKHAGRLQVDAAGDKAEKAPVRRKHRVGEADEVVAREGNERVRDEWLLAGETLAGAAGGEPGPLDLQGLGGDGDDDGLGVHDGYRVEGVGALAQLGHLLLEPFDVIGLQQRRQLGGAVGKLPLGRAQHGVGGGGELGGIDPVGLQGTVDQQLSLCLMDGVEAVAEGGQHAEHGQGQDEAMEIKPQQPVG
ncbi:hypothetical protein D3C71_1248840 [compost metagenome]